MSIKNLNELKRLQLIFEKEADKFKKLTFSVIYIGKGWTSQPSKSHCFEKHVVPLWQYYGRVDSKEEYDEQMEIVRNSSALEPIQGAQIYSYAGFEGDDLDYFLRIARRAGNLFSKIEALSFSTKLEKEIVEKLPGLRIHEIHGLKLYSGLFGRPMVVMNGNPVAVWISFIHSYGEKANPLKCRNHDLDLDPYAESLLAIEHLLKEATVDLPRFRRIDLKKMKFKIALSFAGENREYVGQVATIIEQKLGKDCVFYDLNYQSKLAIPNLDTLLQKIYLNAELVVVFLCEQYAKKDWCGLEWRAIRQIIKQKADDKIMFMRFDNVDLPGIFSTDGYIDLRTLSPNTVADHILSRLL